MSIQQLRNHLLKTPDDGNAWLTLARLLAQGPPGQELYHAIEQSIKSLPENYHAWLLAGTVHRRERGISAALQWLENMARQNPGITAPRLAHAGLQADSYQRRGEFDKAEMCVQQGLKTNQDSAELWLVLANIRLDRGSLTEAVNMASRAIELDRNLTAARITRADALRLSGSWDNALRDYQEVEKKQGRDPVLLTNMGSCLASLERFDSAGKYFKRALHLNPGLVQARLNIGLLAAVQLKGDEAISQIAESLKSPDIDPETRRVAQTTVDILLDHKRLKPVLESARQSASMDALHLALQQTPSALRKPHQQSLDLLRKLALSCREISCSPEDFAYSTDSTYLPFIEACRQIWLEGGTEELAQQFQQLRQASSDQPLGTRDLEILNVWNVTIDRQNYRSDLLQHRNGEAWLKYWHARLLHVSPEKLPGQYKPIINAIGGRSFTPPECVSGTFREMLEDIRPTVPAGLARGVFMLLAISMIHGFGDGNGRLSRFVLGWELESVGQPAIVIPKSLRMELVRSIDASWDESGIDPLLSIIIKARSETASLLKQFRAGLQINDRHI